MALSLGVTSRASDHFDAPAVVDDPAVDLADLYATMSGDGQRLTMTLSVVGGFAPGVQYVFHVASMAERGGAETEVPIVCTLEPPDALDCWAGTTEHVKGDARKASGMTSPSGKLRVYAGPARDPFFFNADGFSATLAAVLRAAPSLRVDEAGCPTLSATAAASLAALLGRDGVGGPPKNRFLGAEVSALVVEVERALVTPGGSLVAVWASARR